jgi:hypothetical protein
MLAVRCVAERAPATAVLVAVEVALRGDAVIPRAGVGALIEQLRGGVQEQTSVDGLPSSSSAARISWRYAMSSSR